MLKNISKFANSLLSIPPSVIAEGTARFNAHPNCVNVGTAENNLLGDLLLPIHQNRPYLTEFDLTYRACAKLGPLNECVAKLYQDHLNIKEAKPDQFIYGCGICMCIESLVLALCDPGDKLLIPAPCFGGLVPTAYHAGAKVEFIDTDNLPSRPPDDARLIVLSNPGNPYGDIIPNSAEILEWAYKNPRLHVLSDDVYALSNKFGKKYQSIATLPNADPEKVHQVYGLSKDWGMAGAHVGILWSRNPDILKSSKICEGNYYLDSDMIYLLKSLWGNIELRDRIVRELPKRLTEAENICVEQFKKEGIKIKTYENSLFIMMDFRDIIKTVEEEMEFFNKLIDDYGVYCVPGVGGLMISEPGWFRFCYSVGNSSAIEGIKRIAKGYRDFLAKKKK